MCNNLFLDFEDHCKVLTESGTRALGAVIAKLRIDENLMYATYTKCIDSSVYPVVEYGSEVWGYVTNSCTDQVQLKAIRAYSGVNYG